MLVRTYLAAICIIALLLVANFPGTAQQGSPSATQPPHSTVTVSEKDNGKDVDLTTGQTLVVKLNGNPSTGYAWTVSGNPAPLQLWKTYHQRSKSGMAGAPQVVVFEFRGTASGVTNLTLIYRRGWEYNVAPARSFRIRVNVR